MPRIQTRLGQASIAGMLVVSLAACGDKNVVTNVVTPLNSFTETPLVADASGASTIDTLLVNPWGIAFGPTGVLWVSNNGTGTSTLYNADGTKNSLVVSIPSGTSDPAAPTGVIFNSTSDFGLPGSAGPALFLFAAEDGSIAGWNAGSGSNAVIVQNRSSAGAVYKGLAIATNGGANFLYATNFKQNAVDVFDNTFHFVNSFSDPTMAAGFAPFGIANIGGQLWVTYAKQKGPDNMDDTAGVGNGFVDVFNPDGTLARRFASNGTLNSPWAVVVAPAGYGPFAGDILVGNFGDGHIGAYDRTTGAFIDLLHDATGAPLAIDGLWGLTPAPGGAATLFFAAGPDDEQHGLVGTLTPR